MYICHPDNQPSYVLLDCSVNFQCSSGECAPIGTVCDGFKDCKDGSDEAECKYIKNCSLKDCFPLVNYLK